MNSVDSLTSERIHVCIVRTSIDDPKSYIFINPSPTPSRIENLKTQNFAWNRLGTISTGLSNVSDILQVGMVRDGNASSNILLQRLGRGGRARGFLYRSYVYGLVRDQPERNRQTVSSGRQKSRTRRSS